MNRRRTDKAKRQARIAFEASELFNRERCEFLIDGYNLMHVTRFKPIGDSEGELRRCRDGLLDLLAKKLSESSFPRITIVFDANDIPARLPSEYRWKHLLVLFAKAENSADDLIAKLVRRNPTPQDLIVVSSDHRVQRAASRRQATGIDSDVWFDALLDWQAAEPTTAPELIQEKPGAMNSDEVAEFKAAMQQSLEAEQPEAGQVERESPFPKGFFDGLKREFPDEFK